MIVVALLVAAMGSRHVSAQSGGSVSRPNYPCQAFTDDAAYVRSTIFMQLENRDVTLRIPVEYFEDSWDRAEGFRDTSQLLTIEIGSFRPVTRAETGERNKAGIRNWMSFLIGDTVPLVELATQRADLFGSPRPNIESYGRRSGPFGLTWIETKDSSLTDAPRNDLYLAFGAHEEIEAVIQCTSPKDTSRPFPVCSQFFRASALDVELSYLRVELGQWQAFQSEVSDFLSCSLDFS